MEGRDGEDGEQTRSTQKPNQTVAPEAQAVVLLHNGMDP